MATTLQERYRRFRERIEKRGLAAAIRNIPLARLLALLKRAPKTDRTDRLFAYLDFVRSNGRRPRPDRLLFNDAYYRLKASGALGAPRRVATTDKDLAKRYIAERVGPDRTVPTLAVLRTEADLRTYAYPERCAIKPTHATRLKVLREAGEPIDLEEVASWLHHDQYAATREANYRGLEPKIIVEPLLEHGGEISVFCYRGTATLINARKPVRRLYTADWVDLGATWKWRLPPLEEAIPAPSDLEAIVATAEALAAEFPLVRIDIYLDVDGGGHRVGEITHCPSSAGQEFRTPEHERFVSSVLFGQGGAAPH